MTSNILTIVLTSIGLAACSPAPAPSRDRLIPADATREAASVLDRPLAGGEDDGLEVARWSVAGDDAKIRRALTRHAVRGVSLDATADALERHGFRAAVVRDASLPSLLAELGGTTTAIAVWHGQAPDWREITSVELDDGRVVMVDGRAERLGGTTIGGRSASGSGSAWLRCMARGWTVPLEDGAIFELQVAPQLLSNKREFSGARNRDELRGRVFEAASIRTEMPPATALILVGTAPAHDVEDSDPEGDTESAPAVAATSRPGPPAELPPSIGELLLSDFRAIPKRRIVLVLRVRLPDTLVPHASNAKAPAGASLPGRDLAAPF